MAKRTMVKWQGEGDHPLRLTLDGDVFLLTEAAATALHSELGDVLARRSTRSTKKSRRDHQQREAA